MTRTEQTIDRLRQLKLKAAAAGPIGRLLVPFIETAEFSLSHGLREVVIRARQRLFGPTVVSPAPPAYAVAADEGPYAPLSIPPAGGTAVTSIVIPVLNNPGMTHRCLASIIEQTPTGTYEVILIDNASNQITQDMLAGVSGLKLIRNEVNQGFVGACNQGGKAATGDAILFLNNDTVVLPGWVEALRRPLVDPSVGAVGAKLIYPSGLLQEAGSIIWSDGDGWNYGRNEDPGASEFNYLREVDYCSGACLLVRQPLFAQLEGFDTRYAPAYYEDVDLCFRLREQGHKVLYQPTSRIVHFEGATSGTDVSTGYKSYQRLNHVKFIERHATALAAQYPHDPAFLRSARDRNRGKRILVMDHMVPHFDQDAGSVRMMALLQILIELGYRVTFLPDNLAGVEPYTSEMQQLGVEVLYGPRFGMAFLEAHAEEFDIAILCRAHFAMKYLPPLLAAKRRPFIIFDTVDLHYLREQRLAALANDPALASSAEQTRSVEFAVMRSSDMVWLTSTHEAELLRADPSLPTLEVVPTIHSVRDNVPAYGPRRHILFLGGFRHAPNEDAAHYFVKEILPLVRTKVPDAQFLIAGSHMPDSILGLASEAVRILGHVPDLEPVLDSCRVMVAPLRYGAGVKGKVTQSLAWGLPTVATPVAAEGLNLLDGEHLFVAADPGQFAERVVEVYQNEAQWARLSQGGRRHVDAYLGHESVRESIRVMLAKALGHD